MRLELQEITLLLKSKWKGGPPSSHHIHAIPGWQMCGTRKSAALSAYLLRPGAKEGHGDWRHGCLGRELADCGLSREDVRDARRAWGLA